MWVAWPCDHEVRIIWYQRLAPLIRLSASEIFWSWIPVIYFQISSWDHCNPISCACSKLIPLIASSFSPTIVYRFLTIHTQIWPTMSFNLNKKFNKEYKQPPQSTKENSFQSNSKSKKTICFSPQSLIFLISS